MVFFKISSLVVLGTVHTLCGKVVYELYAEGVDGDVHKFRKPYFMCFVMLVAMCLSLLSTVYTSRRKRASEVRRNSTAVSPEGTSQHDPRGTQEFSQEAWFPIPISPELEFAGNITDPLLDDASSQASSAGSEHAEESSVLRISHSWQATVLVTIPTMLDITATILSNIGLLWITVSCQQMLRVSIIVFSGFIAMIFQQRQLKVFHFMGIILCMAGVLVVTGSNMLGSEHRYYDSDYDSDTDDAPEMKPYKHVLYGAFMVVIGQLFQASGIAVEERLLSTTNLKADELVGLEGLLGVLLVAIVALPAANYITGTDVQGREENLVDTVTMITNSPSVAALLVVDTLAVGLFNVGGMTISPGLDPVFLTVVESLRTLLVWAVDLALYYLVDIDGAGQIGERFGRYSWMQGVGFVLLVAGSLVYSAAYRLSKHFHEPMQPGTAEEYMYQQHPAEESSQDKRLGSPSAYHPAHHYRESRGTLSLDMSSTAIDMPEHAASRARQAHLGSTAGSSMVPHVGVVDSGDMSRSAPLMASRLMSSSWRHHLQFIPD